MPENAKIDEKQNYAEKLYNYIINQEGYVLELIIDARTNYLASHQ